MGTAEVDISSERTAGRWRRNVGPFGDAFDIDGVVVGEIDGGLFKGRLDIVKDLLVKVRLYLVGVEDGIEGVGVVAPHLNYYIPITPFHPRKSLNTYNQLPLPLFISLPLFGNKCPNNLYLLDFIAVSAFIIIMRRQPPVKPYPSQPLDVSSQALKYGRQNIMGSLQTMAEQDSHLRVNNATQLTKEGFSLAQMNQQLYRPANYRRAVEYKNSRSYLKKSNDQYRELDLFCDTEELKYFGLGVYFYIELFRRLTWLFLAMTIVQGINVVINYKGDGLSNYEASFSTYLIKSTLGNYSGAVGTTLTTYDEYLVAMLPAVNFLALFIFTIIWRTHLRRTINKQEEDNTDVKPEKFCIEFEGFDERESNEEDLRKFFSQYGPVYEASYVRDHQNKLGYFQDLDEIEEDIKTEELEIIFGSGSSSKVGKLKTEKQQIEGKLRDMNFYPTTKSAYVHFQFEKTKKECLEEFKTHYLYSKCSHGFCRAFCCCCLPDNQQKVTFRNGKLLVKAQKVPAPEDINWDHFQISACNRFFRNLFAFFIILLFLALSCSIIGLCSIYISSHSNNCDGLSISTYTASTAAASGSTQIMQCYCNAHLIDSFTDSTIKTACANYLTDIYVEQSIQYVVIVISSLMNFIFGLIVDKIIGFVRPVSQDAALSTKTAIYTIFLIINSIIVPILIYADIFGFKASSYVSFVTLISSDVSSLLKAQNISLYPHFSAVWYRNVSPIFTNFLIFNTAIVWVTFFLNKCCFVDKSNLESKEGKILQKNMNREIVSYKLDIYKEAANLYLVLVMILIFFVGVPILLPIGFLNILTRYVTNRSLLQKDSVRIDGLGQDFSQLSVTILTVSMILFPLMGEWMLIGNSKVQSTAILWFGSLNSFSNGIYELSMELYLPFYIGLSVLTILELIVYNTVIRFCTCLCSCCASPPPNYHSRPFGEYAKGMNILCSYSIRKNDSMKNAILILEKYLSEKPKL